MDDQAIFDTVVNHLRVQGGPALDANGDCVYRGESGSKCAVGCLISDEHYTPELEGRIIKNEDVLAAVNKSLGFSLGRYEDTTNLLFELQLVHDNRPGSLSLEKGLESVAKSFNLQYTPPKEAVQ